MLIQGGKITSGMSNTSLVVGSNCRSWISSFWNTTLPGAVATLTPTSNLETSVWLICRLPPLRPRSAAKFSMPLTRLSPRLSTAAFSAAGLDIRKFDGEKASVIIFMKNSARRLVSGSTSCTPDTSAFSQLDESR